MSYDVARQCYIHHYGTATSHSAHSANSNLTDSGLPHLLTFLFLRPCLPSCFLKLLYSQYILYLQPSWCTTTQWGPSRIINATYYIMCYSECIHHLKNFFWVSNTHPVSLKGDSKKRCSLAQQFSNDIQWRVKARNTTTKCPYKVFKLHVKRNPPPGIHFTNESPNIIYGARGVDETVERWMLQEWSEKFLRCFNVFLCDSIPWIQADHSCWASYKLVGSHSYNILMWLTYLLWKRKKPLYAWK